MLSPQCPYNASNLEFYFINHIKILFEKYPDQDWDYHQLSMNPGITIDLVLKYQVPWDYRALSCNSNITWSIVKANPQIPWNYRWMSNNPNITWEIVKANLDKPWSFSMLCLNPNITFDIVQSNQYFPGTRERIPWNYSRLSWNINITWGIVQNNPQINWDYDELSTNPNIDWPIIEANQNFPGSSRKRPWNYCAMHKNPSITFKDIKHNRDKFAINYDNGWPKNLLSNNNQITWRDVEHNPKIPWINTRLARNPHFTWEKIQRDIEKDSILKSARRKTRGTKIKRNWKDLSYNPNITHKIVSNNMDKPWSFRGLSKNEFELHPTLMRRRRKKYRKITKQILDNIANCQPGKRRKTGENSYINIPQTPLPAETIRIILHYI